MIRKVTITALYFVFLLPMLLHANDKKDVLMQELEQTTQRGRALYEYDQAAWHSSDALEAIHADQSQLGKFIAQKTEKGWQVAFGHLNQKRDAFLIGCIASQAAGIHYDVKCFSTPEKDTAFFLHAALAADTALAGFKGEKRTYNIAILPASDNQMYVYIYPAQTITGIFPLGADERYLISSDGVRVLEDHRMHRGIMDFDLRKPAEDKKMVAGYHVHVLSEVPEDSDIYFVLSREPHVPEYIGTNGKTKYLILEDGSIKLAK